MSETSTVGKREVQILLECILVFVVINGHQDTFLAPKYRDKINDNFDVLFDVDLKVILPKLREKSQSFYFSVCSFYPVNGRGISQRGGG